MTLKSTTEDDRPPQFVMLAFDGSYGKFWDTALDFARDVNSKHDKDLAVDTLSWNPTIVKCHPTDSGELSDSDKLSVAAGESSGRMTKVIANHYYIEPTTPGPVTDFAKKCGGGVYLYKPDVVAANILSKDKIKWTIFVSCVYYLYREGQNSRTGTATNYDRPNGSTPGSNIGFGDTAAQTKYHILKTNQAIKEGHEIASHMCGHYDSSKWTQGQYTQEFREFNRIMDNVGKINGWSVDPAERAHFSYFKSADVVGMRVPLLTINDNAYPALKAAGFRYDTSRIASPNYWPRKIKGGIWNFPLATIPVSAGWSTLSMDYNFFYQQSKAQNITDPNRLKLYKQQMLDAYRSYFKNNYYGNRAPIDIGHHFLTWKKNRWVWNNGIYWDVMKEFALEVCMQPEVICGTYSELADYMDGLTDKQIQQYQAGNFKKYQKPQASKGLVKQVAAGQTSFAQKIESLGLPDDRSFTVEELNRSFDLNIETKVNRH